MVKQILSHGILLPGSLAPISEAAQVSIVAVMTGDWNLLETGVLVPHESDLVGKDDFLPISSGNIQLYSSSQSYC